MADALLGPVFEKLRSLAENELATISGINGKVEKLLGNLEVIRAVVEDAEQKQITDESIKRWLEQLKDAVYVLDDILDECSIESHRLSGLCSLIKNPKNIMFRRKIGNRLKEITIKFDDIAERKKKFMLESYRGRRDEVADHEEHQTLAAINEPEVYGRQDDKEKIMEFLLSEEHHSHIPSVYPIVGFAGIGKTTLSQMVYNDCRVSSTFNPKIWICISDNFSVTGILRSIIKSVTEEEKYDALDLLVIERKVQELLQGKRYLLVLDDVWIQNQQMVSGLNHEKWNQLKSVLSCGSKGASVLVSTCDMDVVQIMGTCQAHRLQGLSKDDCWLLFKQHAFGANNEECAELIAIGKEIVKKCGGSPLAAQALGGLLRLKNDKYEWVEVKESSFWNLRKESSILPALTLSYIHLTPTIRQCFAFCAIFPKDTKIIKEDLIYLWMANGFISSRENMEVEDVGNMVWNELYRKSFFKNIFVNDQGKIIFEMHDLVHDLAEFVTGKDWIILKNANITDISAKTHHIFFDSRKEKLSFNVGTFKNVESLRTLYQMEPLHGENYACLPAHQTLRVLQTSSFNLSSLGSLIHLRYLELFEIEIKTLPPSVYNLRKLEILKLKRLRELISLPKYLTRLQNLRHFVIEDCPSLSDMFPNIGKLSSLRTLSDYIVSSKRGHSLAELHDLKLGGNLHIKGLQDVSSLSDAQGANLKTKIDLHNLRLSWPWGTSEETMSHGTILDHVLEGLQPHSNLKKLGIFWYAGLKSPSWIGMLNNLTDLELHDCNKCMQLSSLGKLPSLRRLELCILMNMKYIDDDESYDGVEVRAFPSLEELILKYLPNLERLLKEEKREMFPHLSKLCIYSCPELELSSRIPSLSSLDLRNYTNDLASFPVETLTCLRTLSISDFPRMMELPEEFFNNLNALECLFIRDCHELESLPEQGWEGFRSLRTLGLYDCSRLRSFPDGIQHLNALEELEIIRCTEFECLPEQGWEGLGSLRTLELKYCTSLRSLPDGVRHLTSLERLAILECPALAERCKERTGEDWDKIAHVPQVIVE